MIKRIAARLDPDFEYLEVFDILKQFKELYKLIQSNNTEEAKQAVQSLNPKLIDLFKDYLALRREREMNLKSEANIIYQVKMALESSDNIKSKVKNLMEEASEFFQLGNIKHGLIMLTRVYKDVEPLLPTDELTEEFISFLTEEDMVEWVKDVAEDKIQDLSEYDEHILQFVMIETLQLVEQKKLFKDQHAG